MMLRCSLRCFSSASKMDAKTLSHHLKARFKLDKTGVEWLKSLTKMDSPAQMYPFTRAMKRKIICHLGPTNSGKTFAAIEELKRSVMHPSSGGDLFTGGSAVYCAPLRLLAQEMYDKMNAAGIKCSLRTGEVSKKPKTEINDEDVYEKFDWNSAPVVSCTVEMLNMRKIYSVAVIDEIQMIADDQRGWAFTQALLGCNTERLYLCGELAARPLIEKIMKETGEEVEFVGFDRLTPLQLMPKALNSSSPFESGDCIVTFSRKSIFRLKKEIEQQKPPSKSGEKVAVVYGALPAESRALQAAKFNDLNSGVDILVASDAIGMGLNLNIKRIIFDTLFKYNGTEMVPVPSQQIRQIAGRAGRFGTKHEVGLVTCRDQNQHSILAAALEEVDPEPYKQAGIAPSFDQIDRVRVEFPKFDLADIIDAFQAFSHLPSYYFMNDMRSIRKLLDLIRGFDLSAIGLEDLFLFLSAPVKTEDEFVTSAFQHFAYHFIKGNPCPVDVHVPSYSSTAEPNKLLQLVESSHKALEVYLWLNTRFPHYFPHRRLAEEKTEDCCQLIDKLLSSWGQYRQPVLENNHRKRQ